MMAKKQIAIKDFMESRFLYDAMTKAIARAKGYRLSATEYYPLSAELYKLSEDYKTKKDLIIASQTTNVVDLGNGWIGLLYKKGKKTDICINPLTTNGIEDITIDFVTDRLQEKDEYDQFIHDHFNQEVLAKYKNDVLRKADEYLFQFFQYDDKINKNGTQYFLTLHCITRWDERINNGNGKIDANKRKDIVKDIVKSFVQSKLVYYKEETGSYYYLNYEDLILYVVTEDNIIATLWKNEFGFSSDEINRQITLLQLEKIQKTKNKFDKIKYKINKNISDCDREINDYQNKIKNIEKQINDLLEQKNDLIEQQNEVKDKNMLLKQNLNDEYQILQKEENFILKPHRLVTVDDKEG